ncbi:MAG: hypothetical protein IKN43_03970 [Selenomonadaceae bacterium]|nr:hypothetical protein [Selenomonadaceae bacterium]
MTEAQIDKLLDLYETIERDDVPRRETFWGVLKALGKASEFMDVLRKDEDE